ncbi:MAG: UDP-N-acetylmuramoyl-tripeptide--D-alanyl-D-alanine ligase [bacterium]
MNPIAKLKQIANSFVVYQLRRRVEKLLSQHDLTIITVTGTIGKTSAKVAIGHVLEKVGRKVSFSSDSYNTEVGVPLAMFNLKAPDRPSNPASWRRILKDMDVILRDYPYDTIVIEIAEDERAMMTPWVKLLKPKISLLTGASAAHMERFESVEHLRDDAVWLAEQSDRCYYNADMPLIRDVMERKKSAVGYGLDTGLVRFESITRSKQGTLRAELIFGKERQSVKTQMIARHGLSSLLAAAAVAHELEVPIKDIARALADCRPVMGRMRLLDGVNGSRLIDDSYNSSPTAVMAGLDTLMEIPAKQHIAVLGSMNELGDFSSQLHREVAAYAAEKSIDMLVTVGKDAMNLMAPAAIEAGLDKSKVKLFRTPYEAGHYLKKHVQAGDLVFIKGSQNGVFTEETSRILLSPELHPGQELVRQSKAWKSRKKKSFGI